MHYSSLSLNGAHQWKYNPSILMCGSLKCEWPFVFLSLNIKCEWKFAYGRTVEKKKFYEKLWTIVMQTVHCCATRTERNDVMFDN